RSNCFLQRFFLHGSRRTRAPGHGFRTVSERLSEEKTEDRRQKTEDRSQNPNSELQTANGEPRTPAFRAVIDHCWLTRISHGPVRNAHGVPTFVGVSRELRYSSRAGAFAPASCFPSSLRRVTFSQIEKFVRRSG